MNGVRNEGWLQLFLNIPPVTRLYTSACILITIAAVGQNCELISQFDLYFNPRLIYNRLQLWRLFTPFLFTGTFNMSTVLNLMFTYRFSRSLEEASFHRRSSDYCLMLIFMGTLMLLIAGTFTNMTFFEHSFTHALLYVWCRRNPRHRVIIFGLLPFYAHHVPYVLAMLSILSGTTLTAHVVAIAVGHMYYFLEDVFPLQNGGFRILKTPHLLKVCLDDQPRAAAANGEEARAEDEAERLERDENIAIEEEEVPAPFMNDNAQLL